MACEALGAAHPQPVRGVVGTAVETRRVHEGLGQLQRMPMRRLPVRAQAPQAAPQHPRGQVPGPRRYRQDQKPRVVADQVQAPELHRPVPAQPAIPRCALERSRLPAQQRQPVPAPHRDVTQPAARELPKPQVVVPRHEIVPSSALVRARQPHFHLAHDQLSLVESICHAPLYTNRHRKASPRCRHPEINTMRLA